MAKPIIAIVGRPNVGKSTLFNKLIGERVSIVDDTPGVTRDRVYGECEWQNRVATIIDTGGIEPYSDDIILQQMQRQAQLAIDTADVIMFVTDLKTGIVASDMEVAQMLMKSGKPVVLCVNKSDSVGATPPELYEFYNLGIGDPFPVSSIHGHGTGDLLDEVFSKLPEYTKDTDNEDIISVAVIGKPNVGKSSLINKITDKDRCIVSNIPGTTRDSTDTQFENKYGKYNFIDTAGIRRKSRIDDAIEKYSIIRAQAAIERCDVCVIMIDAQIGHTEQDNKIAGMANKAGKACIIAVNKWDAIEKDNKTATNFIKDLRSAFSFMSYAHIVFISAKTGHRLDRLFSVINDSMAENSKKIKTGLLNNLLAEAITRVQPPSEKGRRLKIYYITQIGVKPPTFALFCNDAKLFHFSYQRYIENRLRDTFGFEGTPIRLVIKQREKGL